MLTVDPRRVAQDKTPCGSGPIGATAELAGTDRGVAVGMAALPRRCPREHVLEQGDRDENERSTCNSSLAAQRGSLEPVERLVGPGRAPSSRSRCRPAEGSRPNDTDPLLATVHEVAGVQAQHRAQLWQQHLGRWLSRVRKRSSAESQLPVDQRTLQSMGACLWPRCRGTSPLGCDLEPARRCARVEVDHHRRRPTAL